MPPMKMLVFLVLLVLCFVAGRVAGHGILKKDSSPSSVSKTTTRFAKKLHHRNELSAELKTILFGRKSEVQQALSDGAESRNQFRSMGRLTESLSGRQDLRWVRKREANQHQNHQKEQEHEVIFAVKQKNVDTLTDMLLSVSDPFSDAYGRHMTKEEVSELSRNPEGTAAVLEYLKEIGATVTRKTDHGEYIQARAPVEAWEKAFDTKFHVYEQTFSPPTSSSGSERVVSHYRTKHYSLPHHIATHVSCVLGTVQLPMVPHEGPKYRDSSDRPTIIQNNDGRDDEKKHSKRRSSKSKSSSSRKHLHTEERISSDPVSSATTTTTTKVTTTDDVEMRTTTTATTAAAAEVESSNATMSYYDYYVPSYGSDANTSSYYYYSWVPYYYSQSTDNSNSSSSNNGDTSGYYTPYYGGSSGSYYYYYGAAPVYIAVNGTVTPTKLNKAYSIHNNNGTESSTQALYESIRQTFSPSDLIQFQSRFDIPLQNISTVIGGHESNNACYTDGGNDCGEANLDVQYIMAVSQVSPTTYWYSDDWMQGWIFTVAADDNPPKVISISYGSPEPHNNLMAIFNLEALKLGLQGVTLVAASGDEGAVGSYSSACGYKTSFPVNSPYVLAVGATQGVESDVAETACMGNRGAVITTGGGFSLAVNRPRWQDTAVTTYFNTLTSRGIKQHSGYNTNGRGYPDISAAGASYEVVLGGGWYELYGTSASTPVVAGMVSLVNAARMKKGLSAVGWINPALYALYSKFTMDVTSGDNKCSSYGYKCCEEGFEAAVGWDPVTGFGTLNFTLFKETFLAIGKNSTMYRPTYAPTTKTTYAPTTKAGGGGSKPTAKPTTTRVVTQKPTASPTVAAGWLTVASYARDDCEGTPTSLLGYPTGVCIRERYSYYPDNVDYSLRIDCMEDRYEISYFRDESCQTPAAATNVVTTRDDGTKRPTPSSSSSSSSTSSYYYGTSSYYSYYGGQYYYTYASEDPNNLGCDRFFNGTSLQYSYKTSCSVTADLELPVLTDDAHKFVVQKGYDDPNGCSPDTISTFSAEVNNLCYSEGPNSRKWNYPYELIYTNDQACNATNALNVTTLKVVESCASAVNSAFYTTVFHNRYSLYPSNPTSQPTSVPTRPTPFPTPVPTHKPTVKHGSPTYAPSYQSITVVKVSQTFSGITYSEYVTDHASFNSALKTSLAYTLSEQISSKAVTEDMIDILNVTSASSSSSSSSSFASVPVNKEPTAGSLLPTAAATARDSAATDIVKDSSSGDRVRATITPQDKTRLSATLQTSSHTLYKKTTTAIATTASTSSSSGIQVSYTITAANIDSTLLGSAVQTATTTASFDSLLSGQTGYTLTASTPTVVASAPTLHPTPSPSIYVAPTLPAGVHQLSTAAIGGLVVGVILITCCLSTMGVCLYIRCFNSSSSPSSSLRGQVPGTMISLPGVQSGYVRTGFFNQERRPKLAEQGEDQTPAAVDQQESGGRHMPSFYPTNYNADVVYGRPETYGQYPPTTAVNKAGGFVRTYEQQQQEQQQPSQWSPVSLEAVQIQNVDGNNLSSSSSSLGLRGVPTTTNPPALDIESSGGTGTGNTVALRKEATGEFLL